MPSRLLIALLTAAAVLIAVPVVLASTSHDGWPKYDNFEKHENDEDGPIVGTKGNDELLGGHGNDVIDGLEEDDIIWGDYKPTGQTSKQKDTLNGGVDDDFIYTSHGKNIVHGGPGSDVVHARYGRGRIDCGPGRDALYLPAKKGAYDISNCEWKKLRTGESAPKWWLKTHPTGR